MGVGGVVVHSRALCHQDFHVPEFIPRGVVVRLHFLVVVRVNDASTPHPPLKYTMGWHMIPRCGLTAMRIFYSCNSLVIGI